MSYFVKTVSKNDGTVIFFNYGACTNNRYKNTETFLQGYEGITVTVYNNKEFEDYQDHIASLLFEDKAKLITTL